MKLIFSLIALILSGILFFFLVNPLYGQVVSLRNDVVTYKIALNHSTELKNTQDQLFATYKSIKKEDRDRLERFLPNTVNNIKFVLEVERIANLHLMSLKNIKLDSVKLSDTPSSSEATQQVISTSVDQSLSTPYGSFPIEFSVEGDYDTFVLFLKDLERNLRLIDIKSIELVVPSPDKTGAIDPTIYTYNLKVETYWLK